MNTSLKFGKTEVVPCDRPDVLAKQFASLSLDPDWLQTEFSPSGPEPPVVDFSTKLNIPFGFIMDDVQSLAVFDRMVVSNCFVYSSPLLLFDMQSMDSPYPRFVE